MIIHVDMDAFYASVEERENPDLKGKPLVVGGSAENRGVVSAANYVARKFGIHSAMPTRRARHLCPSLIVIPPRGAFYAAVSKQIRAIFHRYSPVVEPLSLDEAFIDPSGSEKLYGNARQIGQKIKRDIKNELELVASVGVAPNKFLAKLASDAEKPDGFTVIRPEDVQRFLDRMPVDRIWGVGKAAKGKLLRCDIRTVADLRTHSEDFLVSLFGVYGEQLWKLSQGIDERKVLADSETKSVSQEITFSRDISELRGLEAALMNLTEEVAFRLRESVLKGRSISLKIRFADFKTIVRLRSLPKETDNTAVLWKTVNGLLHSELSGKSFSVRLIGMGVSNFKTGEQQQADLFESSQEQKLERQHKLDRLSDQIKKRYGRKGMKRGRSLNMLK